MEGEPGSGWEPMRSDAVWSEVLGSSDFSSSSASSSSSSSSSPPASVLHEGDAHLHISPSNLSYLPFYQHSPPVAATFIMAYLFIFLLCMIGNGLVCFIVLQSRRMRTVTNTFILNLAISDLLVGLFCMPTTLVDNLITGWPFGRVTCKMSGLVQGTSVAASVFTLVAIAVDRFRCIVYPFKPKLNIAKAVLTIALIWVLAVCIMCPSAVMLTVTENSEHVMVYGEGLVNDTAPLYACWEAWPDGPMHRVYTTVLFANIYLAPLTLIVVVYARIGVKLCASSGLRGESRSAARPCTAATSGAAQSTSTAGEGGGGGGGGGGATENRSVVSKKKVKVIKMLIIVALLFMLSWLPLWTLMMLLDYGRLDEEQVRFVNIYLFPFAHWFAFFNSSVNPIIYGYFNENFRRGFQAAFKLQLCSAQMDHHQHPDAYSERLRCGASATAAAATAAVATAAAAAAAAAGPVLHAGHRRSRLVPLRVSESCTLVSAADTRAAAAAGPTTTTRPTAEAWTCVDESASPHCLNGLPALSEEERPGGVAGTSSSNSNSRES
ncbi:neuropeptide FF receptor 1-like [Petromyzon marinus]|uniref:neuropeptide FF receptor 1-like n=1 Tax=Petromyzon marinus TaxID=7757 RepID=UPI003F6E7A7C